MKTLTKNLTNLLFYFCIMLFIVAFGFRDAMVGNWYQQFMPNIGPSPITDITFVDSLIGYAVTNYQAPNDTDYILKTTNGGNNWSIIRIDGQQFAGFNQVVFLNANTGFTCGVSNFPTNTSIQKTTNGGQNWININPPDASATYYGISVLNNDTIWVVDIDATSGGVFRTTNGGANWTRQLNIGANNPSRIYMYNRNIGFISSSIGDQLYRTTNSGMNWTQITGTDGFTDMKFVDSLTGYKCRSFIKKTTDGGLTWFQQVLPSGGNIIGSGMSKISYLSLGGDTLWGLSGSIIIGGGSGVRGTLYHTINGGSTWEFQLPDTSINIGYYYHGIFVNKYFGWNYVTGTGIHTTNGGDTTFLTGIKQISSDVPKDFKLYQNFPNPFNPKTIINYELRIGGNIRLSVFDITGKHIIDLVNQKQNAGAYEVDFDGSAYSSGVYFYSLFIDSKLIDTKKMIILK